MSWLRVYAPYLALPLTRRTLRAMQARKDSVRTRSRVRGARTASAWLVGALALAGCGAAAQGPTAGSTAPTALASGSSSAAAGGGTFLDVAVPADVLNAPLQDASGKSFTLASLKGRLVVLANFLTTCHDICPLTSANMRDIAAAVKSAGLSDKVAVVEATVDPARDNPARLAAYQALYGGPTWTLATGAPASIDALWQFLGVPATKVSFSAKELATMPRDWQTGQVTTYDMQHADIVVIIGADGHWRWMDLGSPGTTAAKVPKRLQAFLSEDGKSNLAHPDQVSWTVPAVISALDALGGTKIAS